MTEDRSPKKPGDADGRRRDVSRERMKDISHTQQDEAVGDVNRVWDGTRVHPLDSRRRPTEVEDDDE